MKVNGTVMNKPNMLRSGLLGIVSIGATLAALPVFAQDLSTRLLNEGDRALAASDEAASVEQTGPGVIADPLTRRDLPPPGGPTLLLEKVAFTPESAFLSADELSAIAGRYVGKRLDFAGISALVRDVNDLYAAKGVVTAAAILGPQDLARGELVVTLIEGQVGLVSIVGERLTKDTFITNRVRFAKGRTVDVPTAAKDISWFNRTNSAQLRLLLQPGAGFGMTDLAFGVTEPRASQGQLSIDNNGIASTGEAQVSYVYRRYGLLGQDDTALLFLNASEGSRSITARYDIAVTPGGTRLAFTAATSSYDVIAGPTVSLDLSGKSRSGQLVATQPLVATDRVLIEASLGASRETTESTSAGVPIVTSQTSKLAPGLSLGLTGEGWDLNAQVQYVNAIVDDSIAGSSDDFKIGVGSIDGSYTIDATTKMVMRGAWQATSAKLLPGTLLFSIGGPTTVRGYPAEGVAGDSGYYLNLELHKAMTVGSRNFDGYVFADAGAVYSTFPKVTRLASAGAGVNVPLNPNIDLDFNIAFPLRDSVANQDDVQFSLALRLSHF